MEDIIFETKDRSGRQIYLTKERWKHINQEHPEIANYLEEIKETLKSPIKTTIFHSSQMSGKVEFVCSKTT